MEHGPIEIDGVPIILMVIFYSYVKLPPGSDFQWWFNRVCQAFYGNTTIYIYMTV